MLVFGFFGCCFLAFSFLFVFVCFFLFVIIWFSFYYLSWVLFSSLFLLLFVSFCFCYFSWVLFDCLFVLFYIFFFFFFFLFCRTILFPEQGVRLEPLGWEHQLQDTGLPENSQPQGILNNKSSPGSLHLDSITQLDPIAWGPQCWTPHAKQQARQEHKPTHQQTDCLKAY